MSTTIQSPSRDTIEDFVLYAETVELEDDEERTGLSLFVRHEGGFEYPILQNTDGLTMRCSVDPDFFSEPPELLSENFYEQLGIHLVRMTVEGGTVVHDFWAWLPDDMNQGEGWAIYNVLQWIGDDQDVPFEVVELIERAAATFDEDELVDGVDATDVTEEVVESVKES